MSGVIPAWPARFVDPLPIRLRPSSQLYSARCADDGSPCVVLLPGHEADLTAVHAAFDRIAAAHAVLSAPCIPAVRARGVDRGTPWLQFDCDAVIDGTELVRLIGDSEVRIPYGQADTLLTGFREAAEIAHRVTDPSTGRPMCLGRLSYGNVLFARDGRSFVVGFGRNFPAEKESGLPDGQLVCFQTPEVAAGGPPTPHSDYVAVLLMARSLLPYVALAPALESLLMEENAPINLELIEHLRWFEQRMVNEVPKLRPPIAEGIARSVRIREILGAPLDPEGLRRTVTALLDGYPETSEPVAVVPSPGPETVLRLGLECGSLMAPDGSTHRLGRSLRRILALLVERHGESPSRPASIHELMDAGWPGERPVGESGVNRVYVTLSRLRKIGLHDVIERFDGGYRLASAVRVEMS